MLFNSIEFLFFFIVVTSLFFLLPHKFRWLLLLSASCFFYMFFKPEYILILFFTIVIDYYAGIFLERVQQQRKRKLLLVVSLVANIGVLVIFKYYNFINDNITGLLLFLGHESPLPHWNIILPIGLSFHTFQAMSYTIEVYKKRHPAEKHFGIYALYVMFYPQLVAGPIERPQNILPQFHQRKYFSYDNAVIGLNLIFWGLFKKVVVADRLAIYVNEVFGDIEGANTISVITAILFFSIQIYCDFSGYSDIARGTAKFIGYDLMINFNQPYLSKSISEFWTRWHISLSTWFRDYLYIPLGGNRKGNIIKYRNLVIVFLISGIWHGANWTFFLWGALHAFYLIFGVVTKQLRNFFIRFVRIDKLPALNGMLSTASIFLLVSFAWIFFRAESFNHAMQVLEKIGQVNLEMNLAQVTANKGPLNFILSLLVILILALSRKIPRYIERKGNLAFVVVCTFLIILLGTNGSAQFIYFQF